MWLELAMFVASVIISVTNRPKAAKTKPLTLADFDVPIADEHANIPVLFGTKRLTGANVCWHGDFKVETDTRDGVRRRRYYLGFHFGMCYGPVDALTKIEVDTSTVWEGNITSNSSGTISKGDLFGGTNGEGGVDGDFDVMMGGPTQTANAYLLQVQAAPQPAYRGILSIIWKGGQIGANSNYVRPWSFTVKRITQGWNTDLLGTVWYPEKAEVPIVTFSAGGTPTIGALSGDMNPAHILYECLTNKVWSPMRLSESDIDLPSFAATADTCWNEGMGLSLLWVREGSLEDFIAEVCAHAGLVLSQDPSTGKYTLKAVRYDYTPATLPVIDESSILEFPSWERGSYSDLVNQIIVTYADREQDYKDIPVPVMNLAAVQLQRGLVSETISRSGYSRLDVAKRGASRDLKIRSTPTAKGEILVNRTKAHYKPGDVFKLNYEARGISAVICRVLEVNYGALSDSRVRITFGEDVYGLPYNVYIQNQPSLDPVLDFSPQDPTASIGYEAPFHFLATSFGLAEAMVLEPWAGFICTGASAPNSYHLDYEVIVDASPYGWLSNTDNNFFNQTFTTTTALDYATTTVGITATFLYMRAYEQMPLYGILQSDAVSETGDVSHEEIVRITNHSSGVLTLERGMLDTTPKRYPAGTRLWILRKVPFRAGSFFRELTTLQLRMRTRSIAGEQTDAYVYGATAPETPVILSARAFRPYPPGRIRVNGSANFNDPASHPITITWQHRNRLLRELKGQNATDVATPETGTTYCGEVYDDDTDTLLDSVSGLTGLSWIPSLPTGTYNLRIEIWSRRDLYFDSLQRQIRVFGGSPEADGFFWYEDSTYVVDEGGVDYIIEE